MIVIFSPQRVGGVAVFGVAAGGGSPPVVITSTVRNLLLHELLRGVS